MKIDFDFSIYSSLCLVEISSFHGALTITRSNNRLAAPEATNASTYYYQGPLGFYYNKSNGKIIYGSRAISHYKQYPTSARYEYIANFLNELKQMYISQSNDHLSIDKQDLVLYEAIVAFLTKLWLGNRLEETYDLATTQFVFLLPKENSETDFVDGFLRPLLLKTPWLSASEPKSRLIFINDMQAYVYSLQDPHHENNISLQREGKYLMCNIQNMTTRNEITIELGAAQMVYDKDTVAASDRSIIALGGNPLLEPKALRPTLIHKVTVAPSWEDMRRLAKFIFLRIFAGSSDDIIGDDSLSDYCSDNVHYNKKLFQNLLMFVLMSVNRKVVFDWSHRINMNLYSIPHGELNKEQQEKLSSITYEEIFKNLDNSPNCIPTTNVVKEYLDSNFTDEIINCALVNVDYERIANVGGKQAEYWIYESLLGFYFSKATFDLIRQLHNLKSNRINHLPTIITDYSLKDGCIYKIFKMFEISSKLQQPIIKHHSKSASSGSTSSLRKNQVKDVLIDEIKAYGFYVEANITTEQVIKLSLNQVVETDETKCGAEKSTLPVCSLIYQLDDMYEAICVNMWNWAELGQEEGYSLVSNCNCNTKQLDRYIKFKDQLKVLINDMLTDSQRKIVDLDEKIHFLGENLDCKQGATITHRNVMEIGMLPYLKEITTALASSLKSTSMFVNYKVSSMVITGELLHSWLTRFSTVYGEYMWTQLQAELSFQFHVRQIRAKLIFAKKNITCDHDQGYSPLRRQKYLQISSKYYILNVRNLHGPAIKVYHCQKDRYSKISATRIQQHVHWRIPLWTSNQLDDLHPIDLEEEFLIHLKKSDLHSYQTSNVLKWILYSVEILESSSAMQEVPKTRNLPNEGRTLRLFLDNHFRCNDKSLDDDLFKKTTFPLKVKIKPCTFSASVCISMSLGVNMSDKKHPLNEYIANPSERLTLTTY